MSAEKQPHTIRAEHIVNPLAPEAGELVRTIREKSDEEHASRQNEAIASHVPSNVEEVDIEDQKKQLHQMIQRMSMRLEDERNGKK